MDFQTACHDLRELGIIDEKLISNAVIDQGPKGEEGRLYKEQGIVYEEVTSLRLEYSDILKIDHLWMMTGLTRLQLSNNLIEKIENLEGLVNLKELDLSFNYIERIENLEALKKLEVLTLFQNKIDVLANLNHLENVLTVFSIGNNKIAGFNNVLYFRNFKALRSLNLSGNPVCDEENFFKFVYAYLPQLVYYEYKMIRKNQKDEAREFFYKDLTKLEHEETEQNEVKRLALIEENQERLNTEAFVEYLGGNQLFMSLFEKDSDCMALLHIGDTMMDAYNEFKHNFIAVTKELHTFGLNQLELRKTEIEQYEKQMGQAKELEFQESRAITEKFLEERTKLFRELKELLNSVVDDDESVGEVGHNVKMVTEAFRDLCQKTWTVLMKKELNLFEAIEEVNGNYERNMTDLVNQFIEGAQAQFTQLRHMQNTFNETITDIANKFYTNFTVTGHKHDTKEFPPALINMMQDKEMLINAISSSHDLHLLIIDQREDKLVSGIKSWLTNLVDNMVNGEINRNRNTITEINHFLDTQKNELQEILSTQLSGPGLL